MTERRRKETILKDSTNPLNKENRLKSKELSISNNQGSVGSGKGLNEKSDNIIGTTFQKEYEEEKKSSFPSNNSDSSLKESNNNNISINILDQDGFTDKKRRHELEQKMKYDLNKIYDKVKVQSNPLKNNNLKNLQNNEENANNKKYCPEVINQINKNKNYILRRLVIIQIPLIFLVSFNIILFTILNNKNIFNDLNLFISSLTLSCALSGLTFFLIILIIFGIFRHYYTSNIFRFLCLVNFCVSISLIIIQLILLLKFKVNIKINSETKLTKIIVYLLIFIITGIILIVNLLFGIIAKDSLLIIGGCKNENACPERKIKSKGNNKNGGNYVYFNEEMNQGDINIKTLRKFHACIYSNII